MSAEWVQPGQRVAIVSGGWRGSVSFDTIARVLKRDIVLESGRRFAQSVGGIYERGHSSSYHRTAQLRLPDDPYVLDIQHVIQVESAKNAIATAYEKWWRNPTVEMATGITVALEAWLELQEVTQ